jgi:uncharacterized repeat protein (TIGR02059 family)
MAARTNILDAVEVQLLEIPEVGSNVHRGLLAWDDLAKVGIAMPAVCYWAGDESYEYQSGDNIRTTMQLYVLVHVDADGNEEKSEALDDWQDWLIDALCHDQTLNNTVTLIRLTSTATDEGDPDTAVSSTGGSGTMLLTFNVVYHRTAEADNLPPVLTSAAVPGTSAAQIEVGFFDRDGALTAALDSAHTPATTDFAVTNNGAAVTVSAVTVAYGDSYGVLLALGSTIYNGDTCTVTYTAGDEYLRSTAGRKAPSSSAVTVDTSSSPSYRPAFYSADVSGATLNVWFRTGEESSSLDSDPADTPPTTAFGIMVDGVARTVSSLEVRPVDPDDTGVVQLTLASAVTSGQIVTVAYTKGTPPLLEDLLEVESFTAQEVSNNTP